MTLKRHQKFRLETEKKWTEKWFKFVISEDDLKEISKIQILQWNSLKTVVNILGIGLGFQIILI